MRAEILIEATKPGTVPSNVRYCFNIYESRPRTDWLPVLRGVVVRCDSESTYMINHDVRQQQTRLRRLNHLNFATDPQLQTLAAYQAGAPSQSETETETVAETEETTKKASRTAAAQNVSKAVSSSPTETQE